MLPLSGVAQVLCLRVFFYVNYRFTLSITIRNNCNNIIHYIINVFVCKTFIRHQGNYLESYPDVFSFKTFSFKTKHSCAFTLNFFLNFFLNQYTLYFALALLV